jgi:type I restriction enzyme, S subunit
MTTWTTKPLGDVLRQIKTGSTPRTSHSEYFNGDIPWFTPADIGKTKNLTKSSRTISEDGVNNGAAKLFSEGTVLVTCIGEIGRVGVVRQRSSANQQITALMFDGTILPDYAYYWFIANPHKLRRFANQAVVPILNNERLQEVAFSFPSDKQEQRRIIAQLDESGSIVRARRYALELTNTFLPAAFLELFGDYLTPACSTILKDVLALPLSNGFFEKRSLYGTGVPVIWVDNLYHTVTIDLEKLRRARATTEQIAGYRVMEDDLLFTRSSLVREGIGQINIVPRLPEPTLFECHVIRARVNANRVNPFYVLGLYRSPFGKAHILRRANTATMTTISQRALEELPCPLPPMSLQERFASLVKRAECLRAVQREALRQTEHLFASLLHRTFSGQRPSSN